MIFVSFLCRFFTQKIKGFPVDLRGLSADMIRREWRTCLPVKDLSQEEEEVRPTYDSWRGMAEKFTWFRYCPGICKHYTLQNFDDEKFICKGGSM